MDEMARQRHYYAATGHTYDNAHITGFGEHEIALGLLSGYSRAYQFSSVLDVGSGTGRALVWLRNELPDLRVVGVEPVLKLRESGYAKGIPQTDLLEGDACALNFPDDSFDVVSAFGILHHIREPHLAVAEMLRVARRAIFISDANYMGQGSKPARLVKRALTAAGLWRAADFVRTGGKGYHFSEGDGVFYSYSVFQDLPEIERACETVMVTNTTGCGRKAMHSAATVAVLGLKSNACARECG